MTAVLALGVGAVTASGCVWYVPALLDLRAGADRPASRRLAAAACVTGWATAGLTAPLLLAGVPALLLLAATVSGAAAVAALWTVAAVRRRREAREAAACWAALGGTAPPAARAERPSRTGPSDPPRQGPDGGGGAVRN
ncbi:hypothetical protein ACFU3J_10625 [Streptomyces sp. NPDC057411]|uniref:hypothetical protein n=1 Tax=unclassified Streptomyces TaxID=2593676 RepID=UPI00363AC2A7